MATLSGQCPHCRQPLALTISASVSAASGQNGGDQAAAPVPVAAPQESGNRPVCKTCALPLHRREGIAGQGKNAGKSFTAYECGNEGCAEFDQRQGFKWGFAASAA